MKHLFATISLVTLAACGGGGDEPVAPPAVVPPAVVQPPVVIPVPEPAFTFDVPEPLMGEVKLRVAVQAGVPQVPFVDWFLDGKQIAQTEQPFALNADNITPGLHTLKAVATLDGKAIEEEKVVVVAPLTIRTWVENRVVHEGFNLVGVLSKLVVQARPENGSQISVLTARLNDMPTPLPYTLEWPTGICAPSFGCVARPGYAFDVYNLPKGNHTLRVTLVDGAGNEKKITHEFSK